MLRKKIIGVSTPSTLHASTKVLAIVGLARLAISYRKFSIEKKCR